MGKKWGGKEMQTGEPKSRRRFAFQVQRSQFRKRGGNDATVGQGSILRQITWEEVEPGRNTKYETAKGEGSMLRSEAREDQEPLTL